MSDKIDDGGSAYPVLGLDPWKERVITNPGISKRELFAAMAMQGVLFGGEYIESVVVANQAVKYSDALLAELNKG
jgi:hypothetical protein